MKQICLSPNKESKLQEVDPITGSFVREVAVDTVETSANRRYGFRSESTASAEVLSPLAPKEDQSNSGGS